MANGRCRIWRPRASRGLHHASRAATPARRAALSKEGALDVSLFMRVGAQEAVLYECRYRLLAQANAHAPHAVLPSLAIAPRTGSAGADGRCRGHGHAVPPCTEPERVLLR